jgi:hypothetical protein
MPEQGTAMRQYCSVCKDHLEMTVVSDTNEDGVIWLKCPRCKGILPHMEEVGSGEPETADADPVDAIDVEKAVPYDPSRSYDVGDVLHHRGWDDYGVVLEKSVLPGNRHTIRVRFAEHGEIQLIVGES